MTNTPYSIGVIMDGNRRWARERNLPTLEGHRRGLEKTKELMSWAGDAGVKEIVLYAFSTENWNRSEEEVSYLMQLFEEACDESFREIVREGGRIRFVGQRSRMPVSLQQKMESLEQESRGGTKGTLAVALSYGGRPEIVEAVNALLREGVTSIDEGGLEHRMWSAGLRAPDLIIRTGGERRLSNFLTWQSAYSELFFLETKWPDLSKEDFDGVLQEYGQRERRLGR